MKWSWIWLGVAASVVLGIGAVIRWGLKRVESLAASQGEAKAQARYAKLWISAQQELSKRYRQTTAELAGRLVQSDTELRERTTSTDPATPDSESVSTVSGSVDAVVSTPTGATTPSPR